MARKFETKESSASSAPQTADSLWRITDEKRDPDIVAGPRFLSSARVHGSWCCCSFYLFYHFLPDLWISTEQQHLIVLWLFWVIHWFSKPPVTMSFASLPFPPCLPLHIGLLFCTFIKEWVSADFSVTM